MSPYEALLGVAEDAVVMTPNPAVSNRAGRLHGGAIASLHVIAGERAAGTRLAELMLVYVAPPADGAVHATATVLRRGRLVQVESTLVDAAGATVSRALTLHHGAGPTGVAAASDESRPREGERPGAVGTAQHEEHLPDVSSAAVADASAFAATLGISVVQRERAHGIAVLPWRDVLRDGDDIVHAGALATLVDTASGAAVWNVAGLGIGGRAATVAMHLALQGETRDEDVVAEAHASASFADLVTATLRLVGRRSRRLVATASARYRIVRHA